MLNTNNKKREQAAIADIQKCRLRIIGKKKGKVALDMISLFPHETYKGHGLRKDLAETIAALKPKFVRFPGGCMFNGWIGIVIDQCKIFVGKLKNILHLWIQKHGR